MADHKPRRATSTTAVHGGEPSTYPYHALTAPVVQTATYTFEDTAELAAYMEGRRDRLEYGRYGNPTVRLVENKVAELEGADDALAFSSGMAALTTTVLALTRRDSHVLLFADCYRRTRQLVTGFLSRFGVEHTLLSSTGDVDAVRRAIRPDTRLLVGEAPTNPYQRVPDLGRLTSICRGHGVKTLIDGTFATPVNLRPLDHGTDLVLHSATKYLAGHNDVMGGVVAGSRPLVSLVRDLHHVFGAVLDPHAAHMVHRGLKTLGVRVERQNASAKVLAKALEDHPRVRRVWYPGLPSHPDSEVAERLMRGCGGVVGFELDADLQGTSRFVDACRIPRIAPSLGGVESLIEQPALMSYFELSTEEREAIGIKEELVRYSVGLEDPDEIVGDVFRALRLS